VSDPEEPTIAVRDLTGAIRVWIEIGSPDADRVHKAGKAAGRVAVYTHKDPAVLVRQCAGERIHRAQSIRLHGFDRELIAALAARLQGEGFSKHFWPERLEVLAEMPRTATGKIQKFVLRELAKELKPLARTPA